MPPQNMMPGAGMPPVMPPTTPPQQMSPMTPSPMMHKSHSGLFVSVVVLLAISGGAVFAYPQYKQYLPAPIQAIFESKSENPEVVIEKATKALSEMKSGSMDGEIILKTEVPEIMFDPSSKTPDATEKVNATIDSHIAFDVSDATKPQSTLSFGVHGAYGLNGEINFEALLDTESTKDVTFVRLSKLNLPFAPIDLSFLLNRWISIPSAIGEQFVNVKGVPNFSEADLDKARSIIQDAHLLKVVQDLGEDSVDTEASYHYSVNFDQTGIYDAMVKLTELSAEKQNVQMTEADKANFKKYTEDDLSLKPFEIWISKSDYRIKKISAVGTFSNEKDTSGTDGKVVNVSYTGTSTFGSLSTPLVVGGHPDATDAQAVVQEVVGKFLGGAMIPVKN